MYSRQEASLIRRKFWTRFGQYMRPVNGATGDTVNWLNYKTGVKHIYFRMDAGRQNASVAIELRHTDAALRQHYFEQLGQLRSILEQITGERWEWQLLTADEDGNNISRISTSLAAVNIFKEADWPSIISFLKPRIIALDELWMTVKEQFE